MDTLVFLDPDNGFETQTQRGPKWVRHAEVKWLLERLPESATVVVYQHRPRQRWEDLYADLAERMDYAPHVQVVYEANLAFLVLSRARGTAERLARAAMRYCEGRPGVRVDILSSDERGDQRTGAPGETMPRRCIWSLSPAAGSSPVPRPEPGTHGRWQ